MDEEDQFELALEDIAIVIVATEAEQEASGREPRPAKRRQRRTNRGAPPNICPASKW